MRSRIAKTLLLSTGQTLFLALLIVALRVPGPGEDLALLAIAWLLLVLLTWVEGFESGLLALVLSALLLTAGSSLEVKSQFGALLGIFLGCIHHSRPALSRVLFLAGFLALLAGSFIMPALLLLTLFPATLALRRRISHLEAFASETAARLQKHLAAIGVYLLIYFGLVSTLALVHRALDVHRTQPELKFEEWTAKGAPPLGFYLYFTVTTSLTGPPSDVQIKGVAARTLVTCQVVLGILFLALVLQQMIALTPVLYQTRPTDKKRGDD